MEFKAPIRRNNSIRFEFDEDMPKMNQRSSRSMCRGKCMKKNGTVMNNCVRAAPKHRLLGSFEASNTAMFLVVLMLIKTTVQI